METSKEEINLSTVIKIRGLSLYQRAILKKYLLQLKKLKNLTFGFYFLNRKRNSFKFFMEEIIAIRLFENLNKASNEEEITQVMEMIQYENKSLDEKISTIEDGKIYDIDVTNDELISRLAPYFSIREVADIVANELNSNNEFTKKSSL